MAKFIIKKEWRGSDDRYCWLAYKIVGWWIFRAEQFVSNTCSLKSAEECETRLRSAVENQKPEIVKTLEI